MWNPFRRKPRRKQPALYIDSRGKEVLGVTMGWDMLPTRLFRDPKTGKKFIHDRAVEKILYSGERSMLDLLVDEKGWPLHPQTGEKLPISS